MLQMLPEVAEGTHGGPTIACDPYTAAPQDLEMLLQRLRGAEEEEPEKKDLRSPQIASLEGIKKYPTVLNRKTHSNPPSPSYKQYKT